MSVFSIGWSIGDGSALVGVYNTCRSRLLSMLSMYTTPAERMPTSYHSSLSHPGPVQPNQSSTLS
jgi:hypothetical protein